MQQPPKTVKLNHLPIHLVERLDAKFGKLLEENGGFAEWLLKIDNGKFRYIKSTDTEFLEPTHETRK